MQFRRLSNMPRENTSKPHNNIPSQICTDIAIIIVVIAVVIVAVHAKVVAKTILDILKIRKHEKTYTISSFITETNVPVSLITFLTEKNLSNVTKPN